MTADFQVSLLSGIEDDNVYNIPTEIDLSQNYPNPFNPATNIKYNLSSAAQVKLTVYDILGKEITTLINGREIAGEHVVVWNGRDNDNNEVSSGLYFYELTTGEQTESKKMMLVK
jgi:flagellar hook assembly protein FlgD